MVSKNVVLTANPCYHGAGAHFYPGRASCGSNPIVVAEAIAGYAPDTNMLCNTQVPADFIINDDCHAKYGYALVKLNISYPAWMNLVSDSSQDLEIVNTAGYNTGQSKRVHSQHEHLSSQPAFHLAMAEQEPCLPCGSFFLPSGAPW